MSRGAGASDLTMVLDVWTNRIIGWAIIDHLRRQLMRDALNMALA